MAAEPAAAFAQRFGLRLTNEGILPPCAACHNGKLSRMKDKAERIQDDTFADALAVQSALMDSLAAIRAAKHARQDGMPVDEVLLAAAVEDHRAAHVRWENLVVSENSMGFHNPSEVGNELTVAGNLAQSARENAEASHAVLPEPSPIPPTMAVDVPAPGMLAVAYDTSSCNAADHVLLRGSLSDFETVSGGSCSIGSSGSFTLAMPAGDVWFVIGGSEGGTYSSVGSATAGERYLDGVVEVCPSLTSRNTMGSCP
jgi:hypothetical protein